MGICHYRTSYIQPIPACTSRKLISHLIKPPPVHNGDVNHRPLVVYYISNELTAPPNAIQEHQPPTTDACASDDYRSLDLELESGACYFWYKVHLIMTA